MIQQTFDSIEICGPRLLVSVRDAMEARAAIEGGAEWIDLKQPRLGPLGPVSPAMARDAVAAVGISAPMSAAAGELLEWPRGAGRELLKVTGLQLLKLGLAGCRDIDWPEPWHTVANEVDSAGKQLVLVAYVDALQAHAPPVAEVMEVVRQAPGRWLLLDTFDKSAGRLLDHTSIDALRTIGHEVHQTGGRLAVAGRLEIQDLAILPLEAIDLVAVRSAACRGGREGLVDAALVRQFGEVVRQSRPSRGPRSPYPSDRR